MNDSKQKVSGGCLCGAVTYSAKLKSSAGVCHCGMCRKWSSGPYMSVHAEGKIEFHGTEQIQEYRSSKWAARGFCKRCGSSLYYHLQPRSEVPEGEYILSAGTVHDQSLLTFDHEVFVDGAPGWYKFENEQSRHRMTEAEIMAMFEADVPK